MAKYAEDWAQREQAPVSIVTVNIDEIRPLEDRPRRLFVEGAVGTASNAESGLLDEILPDLQGFSENEDERSKEMAGRIKCNGSGKVVLILLFLLFCVCKLA